MAFAIGEVGIERDATQVLFDAPPIIESRHREGGPTRAYELAITNDPSIRTRRFCRSGWSSLRYLRSIRSRR